MGNGMTTTGWVLTIIGGILIIASIGLIAYSLVSADNAEQEVIAREFNFSSRGARSYQTRVESTEATNTIEVSVESRSSSPISITLKVFDPSGVSVFDQTKTTPANFKVDISSDLSDYWDVVIEFANDQTTMSEVSVEVKGDPISDETAMLCCCGGTLPVIAVVLIITGIILLVVGYKKEKKKKVESTYHYRPPQRSYGGGSSYDPSPSSSSRGYGYDPKPPMGGGNAYERPPQTQGPPASQPQDPNPYYQGFEPPRSAPEAPRDVDYRNDW